MGHGSKYSCSGDVFFFFLHTQHCHYLSKPFMAHLQETTSIVDVVASLGRAEANWRARATSTLQRQDPENPPRLALALAPAPGLLRSQQLLHAQPRRPCIHHWPLTSPTAPFWSIKLSILTEHARSASTMVFRTSPGSGFPIFSHDSSIHPQSLAVHSPRHMQRRVPS